MPLDNPKSRLLRQRQHHTPRCRSKTQQSTPEPELLTCEGGSDENPKDRATSKAEKVKVADEEQKEKKRKREMGGHRGHRTDTHAPGTDAEATRK